MRSTLERRSVGHRQPRICFQHGLQFRTQQRSRIRVQIHSRVRMALTACALRRSGTTARISFALRICRADIEMARFGTCDISAKILAAMLFSVDNGGRQLVRCSERSSLGGEITPISHLKETVMWVWTYTTGCLARSMRAERTCKL